MESTNESDSADLESSPIRSPSPTEGSQVSTFSRKSDSPNDETLETESSTLNPKSTTFDDTTDTSTMFSTSPNTALRIEFSDEDNFGVDTSQGSSSHDVDRSELQDRSSEESASQEEPSISQRRDQLRQSTLKRRRRSESSSPSPPTKQARRGAARRGKR